MMACGLADCTALSPSSLVCEYTLADWVHLLLCTIPSFVPSKTESVERCMNLIFLFAQGKLPVRAAGLYLEFSPVGIFFTFFEICQCAAQLMTQSGWVYQ
jgi:hypothetical protein